MDNDTVHLLENMEEQAESDGLKDQGPDLNPEAEGANGEISDGAKPSNGDLTNSAEGSEMEEDDSEPIDPDNPYAGIIALTEIGIRDSREMIHTPLGLGRYLYQMSCKDKFFGTVATIFFLAVVTITAMRLAIFDLRGSADMTVAIVTFMNCVFMLYYVFSAVFFERPFEIACVVQSVGTIWLFLVVNYALSSQGFYKMVRLIIASAIGPFIMVVGCMIIRSYVITNSVVFRICGSNTLMQERCKALFQYLALIKSDFQIALTMALLVMKDGLNLGVAEWVVLPIALAIAISSYILGYLMVRYEHGRMVLIYTLMWVLEPAYCIYLIIKAAIFVQAEGRSVEQVGLTGVIFVTTILSLVLRVLIIYYVLKVFLNFGAGLRQKAFEGYIDDENRERRDPFDYPQWRAQNRKRLTRSHERRKAGCSKEENNDVLQGKS